MPRPLPKEAVIEPVDDLPDDVVQQLIEAAPEPEPEAEDEGPVTEWRKKAEFRAAMAGGRIDNNGELILTVKVPVEDKYLALPVTDVRGILLVFSVYEPLSNDKQDLDAVWAGE